MNNEQTGVVIRKGTDFDPGIFCAQPTCSRFAGPDIPIRSRVQDSRHPTQLCRKLFRQLSRFGTEISGVWPPEAVDVPHRRSGVDPQTQLSGRCYLLAHDFTVLSRRVGSEVERERRIYFDTTPASSQPAHRQLSHPTPEPLYSHPKKTESRRTASKPRALATSKLASSGI